MRAVRLSSKVACLAAILVFSFPFTTSLDSAVTAGQAFCSSGTCHFESGSICVGDDMVKYNSRFEPQ